LQLTSFVGRQKEIEDVKAYLVPLATSRLATLTGVGGTGKTRLALQVAEELIAEFPDGIWLVEFARITDPLLIPHTAAAVFSLRDEKGKSADEILDNYLRLKRLLLILDNCEHLIDGAAQFADHILHLASGVKILATSREALGLAGETIYLVPSLGKPNPANLPPLESLTQYDAVQLFIDRAVAVLPSFKVMNANAPAVAQICHRLDGIPLAIELAAARVKALSVEQIAARLNDLFRLLTGGSRTALPRQQTLQATIDWSYGLLSEQERALFRLLSVFTGGWSLEAAEAVSTVASNLDPASVLDLLSQLVNKSMLVAGEEGQVYRYRMLETIRQYAQGKLIEAGEAARARDQHLAYFLAFAEEMESRFKTADQISVFDNLDLEINNIRSAVNWAFGEDSGEGALLGLRLVTAIGLYLEFKSIYESIEWLKKGLSLLQGEDESRNRVRAAAYFLMGMRYSDVDIPEAKRWLHKSASLYRSLGDSPGLAFALAFLGDMYAILDPMRGSFSVDMETAWDCCKESEAIFRELHDSWGMRWVSTVKFVLSYFAKDYATLQQLEIENRDAFQDSPGRVLPEFHSFLVLGLGAFEREDYQRSYFYFRRYMELSCKLRAKSDVAYGLGGMGMVAFAQGDLQRMAEHFEEALPLFRETGFEFYSNWALRCLSTAALARGQVECARTYLLESLPKNQEQENLSEMVFFLLHAAGVIDAESHSEYAAKLLGMINIQFESIVANDRLLGQKVFLQWITAFVRSHLDEAAFAAAWAEGTKLPLDQSVNEVKRILMREKPAN
jgi:predicted ATPase